MEQIIALELMTIPERCSETCMLVTRLHVLSVFQSPLQCIGIQDTLDASGQTSRQVELDCRGLQEEEFAIEARPNGFRVFSTTTDGSDSKEIYQKVFDCADGSFELREDECADILIGGCSNTTGGWSGWTRHR